MLGAAKLNLLALTVIALLAACTSDKPEENTVASTTKAPEAVPSAVAALYWFDSRKISDAGHAFYGTYVYERLLPEFGPVKRRDGKSYAFSDGDYLPTGPVVVPTAGAAEVKVLESAVALGGIAYVVAVYGYEGGPFADIDQALTTGRTIGYIGMTTWPGASLDEYLSLRAKLSLPVAFKLEGALFRHADFALLDDKRLAAMGFDVAK